MPAALAPEPARALTLQFLEWLNDGVRTRADVLDVWPSTCPRLSIWEDALMDGLIRFDDGPIRQVVLTRSGRALLAEAGRLESISASRR